MAAEEPTAEDVDAMEAPRQSLLEVVQEKLAERGLVSDRFGTITNARNLRPFSVLRLIAAHPHLPPIDIAPN
jgi:hypothetical protein